MPYFQTEPTSACGDAPSLICRWVYDITGNENLADLIDWLVAGPIKVLFVFGIAFVVNHLLRRTVRKLVDRVTSQQDRKAEPRRLTGLGTKARKTPTILPMQAERSKQRAESLGVVLRSVASFAVYSLAVVIALSEFGINLGPLVAGAGILGVAIGFGAQTLVRDFLSGVFMLVEDQYGVGDVVDLGDATGVVEAVNLRTTRLRDVHGTVWHVPNGEIRRVGNKSQQWARAVIDVGVAYGSDLERAAAVLKEVLDSVWHDALESATVLEEPEIWGIESFGDSAITIRSVLKVEPGEQWAAAREVRKRLKPAFDRAGIEFPFPQRTIWIRDPATAAAAAEPVTPQFESRGEPTED
jgi:small conductance mechanosensitive channel